MDKSRESTRMLKCTFCNFPMTYFVIIIHIAIILNQCNGKTLELTEGDTTDLDFTYPCESSDITLRISNKMPFYSLQHQALYSMSERYTVNVQNRNESGECSLVLRINPVTREDQGLCILTVYINGELLDEYTQRIVLIITYPPGPTSCEVREGIEIGNWVALQCTASAGNLPGQIACYQGGAKLPPQSSLVETDEILQQTFWAMKHSYSTFCCTSALEEPKDVCECKDCALDPSHETQSNTNKEPCHTSQVQFNSTKYQTTQNIHVSAVDPTQIVTGEVTQRKQPMTTSKSNIPWLILYIVIPVTVLSVIINVYAVVVISMRNSQKKEKHVKTELQSKGKQGLSKADYMKVDITADEV